MEFIKSWTMCVCITLIISVIFMTLSPKGTMGKFYKIIISIFIFISFLYPLTNFNFKEFDMKIPLESNYSTAAQNAVNSEIEDRIDAVLEENNIMSSKIRVETAMNEDEIMIKSVNVAVVDDYSAEDAKRIIFDKLGIVADVKRIGE